MCGSTYAIMSVDDIIEHLQSVQQYIIQNMYTWRTVKYYISSSDTPLAKQEHLNGLSCRLLLSQQQQNIKICFTLAIIGRQPHNWYTIYTQERTTKRFRATIDNRYQVPLLSIAIRSVRPLQPSETSPQGSSCRWMIFMVNGIYRVQQYECCCRKVELPTRTAQFVLCFGPQIYYT